MRPNLIVMGPLPPPVHGVAVSTGLVLDNSLLAETFNIVHVDTTDPRSISNMGKWDPVNVGLGLLNLFALVRRLRRPDGVVYLPLSETTGGFIRDSLFILVASGRGWKTAVHCRNSTFREFYATQDRLTKAWVRFTLRRVDAVAVLGDSLRDLFAGLVAPERVSVVPNGTPDVGRASVQPVANRVLYLSNLSRKKGADVAVKAALLVLAREPNAEFIFAGAWEDADFEREVKVLAEPADGRIRFMPPVMGAEKHDLLASAWVLLFPVVRGEGHPRIVLEALAAGVPVVTTDRATIRDTVGDAGYVVPDPDPADLAECVLELVGEPVLRHSLSTAARARYLERFTQEEADRRISDWLAGVARRGHFGRSEAGNEARKPC
jgi:glycosyltransferase involved in cell wall biosynthesis